MKKETKDFVEEGMKRYKQASMVMVSFIEEVEALLQEILLKQKDWGPFKPILTDKAVKSTRYWNKYPALNAIIKGKYQGKIVEIVLTIVWYQSKTDYPFYTVSIIPKEIYTLERVNFDWDDAYQPQENRLRFYPDPNDFNPERDSKKLLDEFVRFLKCIDSQKDKPS